MNGISYDWSTGATDSAITVSPANNTLYSVTVGNKFNCRDTADYLVRTDSAFSLQLAGVDSICAIDTVTLKASGAPFYHWSTGATADSIEVRPGKDSSYWVVGIHNLCRDTITDSIATAPGVSANIFSSEDSICEKDSVTLVGAGGPQYKWSTGEKDDSIEVAPDSTGVYSITISNTHCEAVATERVTVLNRKAVGISGVTDLCPTDTTSLSAKGGGTYEWSTGDKNASITVHPDQSTTYRVTVNNRCGTFTDSITVDLYDLPKVSAGPDTVITEGQKLTLNAEGGVSYTWSPPLYLSCFACSDPVAQPDTSIRYTVFITDSHNCVQAKTVTLQVEDRIDKKLYIPNAFSPNGDGKNEVWRVRGTVDIQQIFVYDRWGNKLFEAEGNNRGWDGTSSNGKKVETGVYVYYIEIKGEDGKTIKKKGTVHLMR